MQLQTVLLVQKHLRRTKPHLFLLSSFMLPFKKTYYSLSPVKHMYVCIYIVCCFAVDILYDLLALFSFGFLCLNDSQRKKQRRCLMLSLSLSAWKSPSPPLNYHQMPSINLVCACASFERRLNPEAWGWEFHRCMK